MVDQVRVYTPNTNGHFVFEAEAAADDGAGGWSFHTTADLVPGHEAPSGGGYVEATSNNFNQPNGSSLSYKFKPDADGFVRVNLVASYEEGEPATETNDSWSKIELDGNALAALPANVNLQPRSGSYKTYSSGGSANSFILANKNVDNNGQPIVFAVEAGEVYDFVLGERSAGHQVDKIVLEFFTNQPSGLGSTGNVKNQPLSPFELQDDEGGGTPGTGDVGAATLSINEDSNNVQTSNFGNGSFVLSNVGDKDIISVDIDVTNALFPDSVFDPYGIAGDTASKGLEINSDGNTGVDSPSASSYVGVGGIAGFEGLRLTFDDNDDSGFNPGETVTFSVDMDPNSVAGATKSTLDGGASPNWDVGGISGAELIGSTFTVTFADGSTATGQLQGRDNQAGSKGLATEDSADLAVAISVEGLAAGGVGTYGDGGPSIVVQGPAGETARIVVAKGIIQPFSNNFTGSYGDQLDAQLAALAASDFPANNAAHFQTVDIVLTGSPQTISGLFDFSQVPGTTLAVDEDKVPLGIVASIIDPDNDDLPMGPVTAPVYLTYDADHEGNEGGGSPVLPPVEGEILLRINAFGAEVAAIDGGPVWEADLKDNAGTPQNENHPYLTVTAGTQDRGDVNLYPGNPLPALAGVVPAAVFDTARSSNNPFSYNIPTVDLDGDGLYRVNLYFAEAYHSAAGNRNFDVLIEGVASGALNDLDPVAFAGNDGFLISTDVEVTDGELNILFTQDMEDNPIISGIEIIALDESDPGNAAPVIAAIDDRTVTEGSLVTVPVTATDAEGDPLSLSLDLVGPGGPVSPSDYSFVDNGNGTGLFTFTVPSDGPGPATYSATVTADDGVNPPSETSFEITAQDADVLSEGDILLRINAFGPEIAAIDGGPNWLADTQAAPISYITTNQNRGDSGDYGAPAPGLAGIVPAAVFDTARSDNSLLNFEIPVADIPAESGFYRVNLYFAETFFSNATGRVFDVALEGVVPTALDDFSPFGSFGGQGGVVSTDVEVTDGSLSIEFLHDVANNPIISGIEVIALVAETSDTPPELTPVADQAVDEGDTLTVPVSATDADDDALILSASVVDGDGDLLSPTAFSFVDNGDGTGSFSFTPDGLGADETFTVTIAASDGVNTTTTDFDVDVTNDPANDVGAATLSINLNSNNVQASNFGNNDFVLSNVGNKKITSVVLDVTGALYPDSVFDPFGVAGDTIGKTLSYANEGGTGVTAPNNDTTYVGEGGIAGFEAILLTFDTTVDGGFEGGEFLTFGVDMDPNSIAGAVKSTLDSGSIPAWDIGGVSGAELIGSSFTVTFEDGSTATGQLHSAGNQGGSKGLAIQSPDPAPEAVLFVEGLAPGGVGRYGAGGPQVVVDGPAGETVRVVLTKGIIQPFENNFTNAYADQLDAQLAALAGSDFPANNAAEFQIVDIVLTGTPQDITSMFDFTQVPNYALPVAEDKLPLGFVAGIIDPSNDDLPIGPVSAPIYLTFNEVPQAANDLATTSEDASLVIDVTGNDTDANPGDTLAVAALDTAVTLGSVIDNGDGTVTYDPTGAFQSLGAGQTATDTFGYTVEDGFGGTDTAVVTVTVTGVNDDPVAAAKALTISEDDGATAISLLEGAVDPDLGDSLSVTGIDTTGTVGLVTDNLDGTVSYDPGTAFDALASGETATDTFTYTISDGQGGTDTETVTVTVTGVNDTPVIANFGGDQVALLEGDPATVIDQGAPATVTDVDTPVFEGGSITVAIVSGGASDEDVLGLATQGMGPGEVSLSGGVASVGGVAVGTVTGGADGTPLTIALSGPGATAAAVSALLGQLTYLNTDEDDPTGGVREITVTVDDGQGGLSASTVMLGVDLAPVNDAPEIGLPGSIAVIEDTLFSFGAGAGQPVQIADVDAGTDNLVVSATVTSGTLTIGAPGGAVVTGSGTTAVLIDGTLAEINAALASLTYLGAANVNGEVTLSLLVTDNGANGLGGTLTDSESLTFTIAAVNDAAVITGESTGSVTEDDAAVLTASGALSVTDVDAGEGAFVVETVTGAYGVLMIDAAGAWTYSADNEQMAIQSLGAGDTLTDSLEVQSLDGTTETVVITLNGVNDAAVVSGDIALTVTEDIGPASPAVGALLVSDVDQNEASFVPEGTAGTYGVFTLDAAGNWTYTYDNDASVIQSLGAGDTLTDTLTVETFDGTEATVTVTIAGTNDEAVITGDTEALVTEDEADALFAQGLLAVTDPDTGEDIFVVAEMMGAAGIFAIDETGAWTYTADNDAAVIQALNTGQTLDEVFTVASADGTTTDVTISIAGLNDFDVIAGTEGADVIAGTEESDFIDAGAGDDEVDAGAGDDQVIGGEGSDLLFGGDGNDLLIGDLGSFGEYAVG